MMMSGALSTWRKTGMTALVGTVLVLGQLSGVAGVKSQLVHEETFSIATSTCEGVSCRHEIVGSNETFGLAAHATCSKEVHYGAPARVPKQKVFELVYNCWSEGTDEALTEEECGATVCLDASTDPATSEVTYQIAFEFEDENRSMYDKSVDVKFYFTFMQVNEPFYTLKASVPVECPLEESCHRSCAADEAMFLTHLTDDVGDGWNAGAINKYDRFRLDSSAALETTDDQTARKSSYVNTLLGGFARTIPLCLADGEYMYSTDYSPSGDQGVFGSGGSAIAGSGTSTHGKRVWSESTWSFCGYTGMLTDFAFFRVQEGVCTSIPGFGETSSPATTPVTAVTTPAPTSAVVTPTPADTIPAPAVTTPSPTYELVVETPAPITVVETTPAPVTYPTLPPVAPPTPYPYEVPSPEAPSGSVSPPTSGGGNNDETNEGGTAGEETASDESHTSPVKIFGYGMAALGAAGIVAAGGVYAQRKGWFGGAGSGGDGDAEAATPNPDVDEFAP